MDDGSHQPRFDVKLRQYQALLEVAESISAHRDLSSLLGDLAQRLQLVVKFDGVNVVLHDPEHNLMRMNVLESPTLPDARFVTQLPIEEAPAGWVWQNQQPLLMTDLGAYESRYPRAIADLREHGVKTVYVLPLTSVGRRLGALGFGSLQEEAWSEEDQEFLQQIAKLVAVAVDNAINFESARAAEAESKLRMERLSLLLDVNNAVVAHLDLREVLKVISTCLRQVIPHDATLLTLHDHESARLRLQALDLQMFGKVPFEEGVLISLEDTPEGHAITSRRPVLVGPVVDLTKFSSPWVRHAIDNGVKSGCAVPLISHDRTLGALSIVSVREDAFNEADAELLGQCASQIAIAVENALNFDHARKVEQQAARERDRIRLLLEINNAVVSHLDLRELVKTISASLRDIMPHDTAGIALYEPEMNQLREYANVAYKHLDAFREGETIPLEGTPAGQVFLTGQPLLIRRPNQAKYPADRYSQRPVEDSPKSACLALLVSHGRKLGIVGLSSTQEEQFTDDDLELFSQIAGQIAIAVENSLNYERARKAERGSKLQSDRLSTVLQINNAVVSHLDLHELLQVISRSLREMVHNDTTGVALYDPESNKLRVVMTDFPEQMDLVEESYLVPLEGSVMGLAFTSGEPVFLDEFDLERFPSDFTKRSYAAGLRSCGNIPLIAHGRKLGALGVASKRPSAFSAEDIQLLCQSANQIAIAVENALAFREIETLKNKLASEKHYLEDEIRTQHNFEELIGESQTFRRILKQVETVAPTDSTVLICGETGTGKELIARAIHDLSARRERTLVKINCAAIPTGLLESELFGHEKGAFTGAISQRIGRFELANRGTLFLDEVGDIPLELQPKLLRVLQEQEFERLGSTRTQKVDVRLIAATNCDLEQMVADRKYRSDLYYRLNVFPITIPALRRRREDIPALTRFFTQKYARRLKKQITAIPAEAMAALINYQWPGNVRELEHFIERAVILTKGPNLEISLAELKSSESAVNTELATLHDAEREHILRVLDETNWVVGGPGGAAARLGMKRTTLQSKMQKLGISRQS
jgi:formate hydrogenlyase transcriptional activator